MARVHMFCIDLGNFSILSIYTSHMNITEQCNYNNWHYEMINEFLFVDEGWIYHKSKGKLEELVELYRLTSCSMEYSNERPIFAFRYSTCIELAKLINEI